jgi:hypothetical protein
MAGGACLNPGLIKNKRPMGHIPHLSNIGPYSNIICISFPLAKLYPRRSMILINMPLFYIRTLSCKIQLCICPTVKNPRALNSRTAEVTMMKHEPTCKNLRARNSGTIGFTMMKCKLDV